jgi:cytochrome c556
MKAQVLFVTLAIGAVFAALAHEGHEHATGVVRERMILMEQMGDRLLAITKRIRSNREFNKIADDAKAIEQLSSEAVSKFPPGSTQAPTAAKPVIWQQWPDFEAKSKKLQAEAQKLAQLPTTDTAVLRAQFRAVAYACDACHEAYRVTKK